MAREKRRMNDGSTINFRLRRSSRLKDALNEIFSQSEFSLGTRRVFVSVLGVSLDKSMLAARVSVDTFGLEPRQRLDLLERLNGDVARQVRAMVAEKIRAKLVPEFYFYHADGDGREGRILELIEQQSRGFDDH
ncbi:MAG: ribosome-binding factor A [Rickettsiales bacterium]|jgi:ribosome-binding factor A|nr:ribosome-binding factor A [Rickettsiales bacterium]